MLKKVRRFLKNNSSDWLNTEVNKDLLQNLSANIKSTPKTNNIVFASLSKGGWEYLNRSPEQVKPSLNKSLPREVIRSQKKSDNSARSLSTDLSPNGENCSQFPTPGTPHWRRIKQVFVALDNAPANYTYSQLIEYVRTNTGKGCSRKLISKWKKQKLSQKFPDNDSGDRHIGERTPTISASPAVVNVPSTVNSLQLNKNNSAIAYQRSAMTVKAWSYLAAAGMAVSLVGCELIPLVCRCGYLSLVFADFHASCS